MKSFYLLSNGMIRMPDWKIKIRSHWFLSNQRPNIYHGRSGTCSLLHIVHVYGRSCLLICGSCLFDGFGLCSCQKGDSIRAESRPSNVYNHIKGRNGWLWLELMQGMVSFKGEPLYQTLGTGAKKWNRCCSWALHQHSRYHMQGNKFIKTIVFQRRVSTLIFPW